MTALLALAVISLALHLAQYAVSRSMERRTPPSLAPVALPALTWPANAGHGRHRRAGSAPDEWAACHSLACAHLTTAHTKTPAGLVCDECGHTSTGELMDDYQDFADEVEHPTREEQKADEIRLDLADEERHAALEPQAGPGPDDDTCFAEFIDGSYTNCGCEYCEDREAREEVDR
ncbi:hypothetical protein ACODT5_15395 [Streptomyces sp. 5.8]|uniref:hypothetical protein n=1 Tax=Streptomyces sp. 5.8 TaxID=3406571 RepID=UPI003BB76482